MRVTTPRFSPALLIGLLAIAACNDGTETPPEESHTPASAALVVDGTPIGSGDPIFLVAGSTVPVEVKFYHDDGDEITGIEGDHFAKLTFTPSTLATSTDVTNQHFHKLVRAGSEIGAGAVTVGYGHDAAADQLTFGPFTVTIVLAGQ
jgi:hypothetical protein